MSFACFSTLALMGPVRNLAGRYEAAGGARIDADFAPTLGLLDRLRDGEAADVVILTREGSTTSRRKGRWLRTAASILARSFVGIAVKAGAEHPDALLKYLASPEVAPMLRESGLEP